MRRCPLLVVFTLVILVTVSRAQDEPAAAGKPAPSGPARTSAVAPRGAEMALSELELDQHVKLVLDSGIAFSGIVAQLGKDSVSLDLSFEKTGLLGSITFDRSAVERAFRLPTISKATLRFALSERLAERRKAAEAHRSWLAARQQKAELEEAVAVSRLLLAEAKKAEEELEARQALLEEFPESEGWGPERLIEIQRRQQVLNQQPGGRERRFMEVFADWVKAKSVLEVMKERQALERRELLEKFPPAEGWSPEKLAEIQAKESAGGELSPGEVEFKEKYSEWEAAAKETAPEAAEEESQSVSPGPASVSPAPEPVP